MIYVVSGVPRSGTSMVMQMLDAGGIESYSDDARKPDSDNPRGYYETEKFKQNKYDDWIDSCDGMAVKIITFHLTKLPEGRDYKILLVNRDLEEVFASANKMLEKKGAKQLDPSLMEIWRKHFDATVDWIKSTKYPCLIIGHRALIEDPLDGANRIKRFLRADLDTEKMASVVSPDLYRNRRENGKQ